MQCVEEHCHCSTVPQSSGKISCEIEQQPLQTGRLLRQQLVAHDTVLLSPHVVVADVFSSVKGRSA